MLRTPTPNTSPQVSPPSSPVLNQEETVSTENKKDPIPPLLTAITPNNGKSCQALLITQKLLIDNSNKVTTFFVDYHDLFSNFQKFVNMINASMMMVTELKSLFNE